MRPPGDSSPQPRPAPWLSVLVPAFDVAPYIEAMLRPVLAQADDGVEILVVDDASTDGTGGIVARVAASDARVRLLCNPVNAGVAAARARLLDAARGDYVWFIDADDVLTPRVVPRLRALLQDDPVDVLLCDFREIGAGAWRRRRRRTFQGPSRGTTGELLLAGSLEAAQFHVWSKVARRPLWQAVHFPPRGRFEDMPAVAKLLAGARTWRHVPEPWIGYRLRAASLSRAMPCEAMLDHAHALDDVRAALVPHATAPAARDALDYFLLRGHAAIARRLARAGADAGSIREDCRRCFALHFPDAGERTLARCRQRGWWLRAWRITTALDAAGWRALRRR